MLDSSASQTQDQTRRWRRAAVRLFLVRPRDGCAPTLRGDGGRDVLRGTAKGDRLIGRAGA